MPSTLDGTGSTPKASRADSSQASSSTDQSTSSSENAGASAAASSTAETELPPTTAEAPVMSSVAGSWSFKLIDSIERNLILSLFQNKDNVFGTGKIRDGNKTLDISASGSVQDNMMDLAISSTGSVSLYKLKLELGNETAYGDYQAYSASGESWNGSADGQMTAPL
ncbi:Uncharacterised protein [uncultured archaeon]|nr:Uncharacterised protein [uncultured archaeon]